MGAERVEVTGCTEEPTDRWRRPPLESHHAPQQQAAFVEREQKDDDHLAKTSPQPATLNLTGDAASQKSLQTPCLSLAEFTYKTFCAIQELSCTAGRIGNALDRAHG